MGKMQKKNLKKFLRKTMHKAVQEEISHNQKIFATEALQQVDIKNFDAKKARGTLLYFIDYWQRHEKKMAPHHSKRTSPDVVTPDDPATVRSRTTLKSKRRNDQRKIQTLQQSDARKNAQHHIDQKAA